MTIYFTSDTHFSHNKDFIYESRGFDSIEEHDAAIIERWNNVVKPNDIVYHLGDAMLGADHQYGLDCLAQLNGTIHMIRGNHDTSKRWWEYEDAWPHLVIHGWSDILKEQGYKFYLCHYPTLVSTINDNKRLKDKLICLCGHTHTKNKFEDINKGLIYHVELDCQNNYPVSLQQIVLDLKSYNFFPVKS